MLKITLDPGHYRNYNRGCISGYFEGNMTFKLAGYLKAALEQYSGVSVVMTKNNLDQNPDLEARGKVARDSGSNVFLSLHSNAAAADAYGVLGIYSLRRPGSKALCDKLVAAVAAVMRPVTGNTYARPSMTRAYPGYSTLDYYGVIRSAIKSTAVQYAIILEHGFHTNAAECKFLADDSNLQQLAAAEAATLAAFFGCPKNGTSVPFAPSKPIPASPASPAAQSIDAFYQVRSNGRWLPKVRNLTDFAGLRGRPITDLAVRVTAGSVKYRVHVKGGDWLPYVTGCNINDGHNGYAGNGKPIDAVEVYFFTPSGQLARKAKYHVSPVSGDYWPWQMDDEKTGGQDGYAGSFGQTIDRLQLYIE